MRAWLIKFILFFIALLPLKTAHFLATQLGQFIAKRNYRITHVTKTNIALCFPHLSAQAQSQLVTQSLVETCKSFIELGALWLWKPDKTLKLVKQVTGEYYVKEALNQGKGAILLTPHLGAWEMMGLYVSKHYPMISLYRPPKLKGLDQFILNARQRTGGHHVTTDQIGIRALFKALKQKKAIGILPDQVPNESNASVLAPFYHVNAQTMTLIARLAQKTGAPVIFSYAERLPQQQGFHIHFIPAPPDMAHKDLTIAATALNQGVEQCTKDIPSQYQWSYKRFKNRPASEKQVY